MGYFGLQLPAILILISTLGKEVTALRGVVSAHSVNRMSK